MSLVQKGIITKIEGTKLYVSICPAEACSSCKAHSQCSTLVSGKELILEDDALGRQVGEEVTLRIKRSQGILAIFLAYLVPVILLIGLLLGLQEMGLSEGASGGIALGVVLVYFIMLRVFRSMIETELTIVIE